MDWDLVLKNKSLPLAIVDLDAIQKNIDHIDREMEGKQASVRLATKSVRVPKLIRYILDHSKTIKSLMCFSAKEAYFLSEQGFDDLLVAYPAVSSDDLECLKKIHLKQKKISLVVDSIEHLEIISSAMGSLDVPFSCLLEVDMSLRMLGGSVHLGVRRSPVRSKEDALKVFEHSKKYKNLKLIGLMGYEAQVAGVGDCNPFKKFMNPIVYLMRKLSMSKIKKLRHDIFTHLEENGFHIECFNGGGSGSLNLTVREKELTEVTVGSGIICSHLFDYYSNIKFEPAVYFALQVVRSSDPGMVTCQGGGYIASGEPGWDRVPLPVYPKGLSLVSMEGAGEVQTPVKLSHQAKLKVGDFVVFRHAKSGELAERFNEYLVVSRSEVVDRFQTYRGMGECYF